MASPLRRATHAVLSAVFLGIASLAGAPLAAAVPEPVFDPARDIAPPDGVPAPPLPMKQDSVCVVSSVLENSQFGSIPINTVFEVPRLNDLAVGRGQTVAVIDSGVNPNVRLPNLIGGGDYVMGGDGLEDCDHHGTLIAGIIAARPAEGDGFVGVAPEATILSIRQTSGAYTPERSPQGYDAVARSASNLHSLAQAIVHAANMGATVINISVTACFDAGIPVDTSALAGALYYAAVEKNIVIVSSAGNVGTSCKQNPGPAPSSPGDPRGWGTVSTVSLPSMWSQFVLSVGGTTLTGETYPNTMGGPWVDVAAPAINVVSLDPSAGDRGALVNAQMKDGEAIPINGTSFAAAYVSGLAALIREKYPDLTANQVIDRIKNTAHTPSGGTMTNLLGSGIVDPVAALTATLPSGPRVAEGVPPKGVAALTEAAPPDTTARDTAKYVMAGTTATVILLALVLLAVRAGQHRRGASAGVEIPEGVSIE